MKLIGDIRRVKKKRDNANADIILTIDQVEYITHKKDGRYYQPFDLMVNLETPITLTGDCLALIENKNREEGDYEFTVFDKTGEEYIQNPDKYLSLTTVYDFEEDQTFLTEVYYSVTVSSEEFQQLKRENSNHKKLDKAKVRKGR